MNFSPNIKQVSAFFLFFCDLTASPYLFLWKYEYLVHANIISISSSLISGEYNA